MMTRLITFVTLLILVASCGNQAGKADTKLDAPEITVADFLTQASPMVEQAVRVKGTVVHVCRHGGQRLFLTGEDSEDRVRITTGEDIAEFEVSLEGSQIEVVGVVKELIIDNTYLAEWEAEVMEGVTEHERGEGHEGGVGHMEHAGIAEPNAKAADELSEDMETEAQKKTTLNQIQSIRDEIAASGNDHLSDYWIETVSFKVLDSGGEAE